MVAVPFRGRPQLGRACCMAARLNAQRAISPGWRATAGQPYRSRAGVAFQDTRVCQAQTFAQHLPTRVLAAGHHEPDRLRSTVRQQDITGRHHRPPGQGAGRFRQTTRDHEHAMTAPCRASNGL